MSDKVEAVVAIQSQIRKLEEKIQETEKAYQEKKKKLEEKSEANQQEQKRIGGLGERMAKFYNDNNPDNSEAQKHYFGHVSTIR